jgi:hypothetical protein
VYPGLGGVPSSECRGVLSGELWRGQPGDIGDGEHLTLFGGSDVRDLTWQGGHFEGHGFDLRSFVTGDYERSAAIDFGPNGRDLVVESNVFVGRVRTVRVHPRCEGVQIGNNRGLDAA